MMKNKEYFNDNVVMAIEVEYADGGRCWHAKDGWMVDRYCERVLQCGDFISDIDYSRDQRDEWCRKVLNLAYYNLRENRDWCNKMKFKSVDEVIDWIIDNGKA